MMIRGQRQGVLHASTIYGLLQSSTSQARSASTVLAFTSAQPRSGVTYTTRMLVDSLNQDAEESALYVDGRALSNTIFYTDGQSVYAEPDTQEAAHTGLDRRSWRSSVAVRQTYLSALRERFAYVLIDCPSIAESSDALLLSQNVDGVISVVEADATTKPQIAYLEATIQRSKGKLLGHILNKRKYILPEWLHQRL